MKTRKSLYILTLTFHDTFRSATSSGEKKFQTSNKKLYTLQLIENITLMKYFMNNVIYFNLN